MEINRLLLLTLNFNAIYLLAQGAYVAPPCPSSLDQIFNIMSPCDTHEWDPKRGDLCPGYPRVELECESTTCGGNGIFWTNKLTVPLDKRLTRNECCLQGNIWGPDKCTNKCTPDASCTSTDPLVAAATCSMNRCNGCRLEWFLGDQDVTVHCGGDPPDKTAVNSDEIGAYLASQFESV